MMAPGNMQPVMVLMQEPSLSCASATKFLANESVQPRSGGRTQSTEIVAKES